MVWKPLPTASRRYSRVKLCATLSLLPILNLFLVLHEAAAAQHPPQRAVRLALSDFPTPSVLGAIGVLGGTCELFFKTLLHRLDELHFGVAELHARGIHRLENQGHPG